MTKSPSRMSTREARGVLAGNDDNRKAAVLGELSALRLLAKHEGLLDAGSDSNKPTLIGINVKHAEVEYEVRDGAEEGSDGAEAEKGEG